MHLSRSPVPGRHSTTYSQRTRQRKQGVSGRTGQYILAHADWKHAIEVPHCNDRMGWDTRLLDTHGTKVFDHIPKLDDITPGTGPALTKTGTPGSTTIPFPYSQSDGVVPDITYFDTTDKYHANSGYIDPTDTEDVVIVSVVENMCQTLTRSIATYTAGNRGYQIALNSPIGYIQAITYGNTTAVCNAAQQRNTISIIIFVIERGGNQRLYLNGTLADTATTPAGSISNGGLISEATLPSIAPTGQLGLLRNMVYNGVGLADKITDEWVAAFTDQISLNNAVNTSDKLIFTRASAATYEIDGVWCVLGYHLPKISRLYGYLAEGYRINKIYNNINPVLLSGWSVTSGSITITYDTAAMLTAGVLNFGPRVFQYQNSTGSDQYIYGGTTVGNTNAHSMQIFGRMFTGSGAQIGWRDSAGGAWTFVADLSDNYVRTIANNLTPPSNTCQLAIRIPNGCGIYHVMATLEEAAFASTPIANWSDVATVARYQDSNPMAVVPTDIGGTIHGTIKSEGWSGIAPQNSYFFTSSLGSGYWVYIGTADWRTIVYDGTNVVNSDINAMTAAEQFILCSWGNLGLYLYLEGKGENSNAYDGDMSGSGAWSFGIRNSASPFAWCSGMTLLRNEDQHLR
jgi:hypothetical protein